MLAELRYDSSSSSFSFSSLLSLFKAGAFGTNNKPVQPLHTHTHMGQDEKEKKEKPCKCLLLLLLLLVPIFSSKHFKNLGFDVVVAAAAFCFRSGPAVLLFFKLFCICARLKKAPPPTSFFFFLFFFEYVGTWACQSRAGARPTLCSKVFYFIIFYFLLLQLLVLNSLA